MSQTILRNKSLGTKVTEAEFQKLEALAAERGLTMSEWVRGVLLGQLEDQLEADGQGSAALRDRAVLAEVVALRTILLNLFYRMASGERVTAEEMRQLIERADADKLAKAQERLAQARQQSHPRPPEQAEVPTAARSEAGAGAA